MDKKYDIVVGLEVHIQMNTQSKAFCGDSNTFGAEPNTNVSAVTLAHPGTLPVSNKSHVEKAVRLGIALGGHINELNFFDRKHYFYPDLPKGYQITQDAEPISIGGGLEIDLESRKKWVEIHHIHMEEDAGKNIHDQHQSLSLLDLNRAGTPLLELVTEPCLSSGEEVFRFIAELQKLLRFIGVSDADMEKGSMRCDCNVSVKIAGSEKLGERCEIKNLNSKRFAREAVKAEALRQIEIIESGGVIINQTMHYDHILNRTQPMREKEGLADYRYFPDPDLAPIQITQEYLEKIKAELPTLPAVESQKLIDSGLTSDYAEQLTQSVDIIQLYKELSEESGNSKAAANLMINLYLPSKKENDAIEVSTQRMLSYIKLLDSGQVATSNAAQFLWPELIRQPKKEIIQIAKELNLLIVKNDSGLDARIQAVMDTNSIQVQQYRDGKKALLGFFIGAVMRDGGSPVDAKELKSKLEEMLSV